MAVEVGVIIAAASCAVYSMIVAHHFARRALRAERALRVWRQISTAR